MRTLNIYAALLFSIFAFNSSFAQTSVKKETIKVWGNCGMCKTTIEKAAKKGGATSANWNEDSKELNVSYALNKTSSIKIQQAIAKSGYDTQDYTADDKAYDNLHGCCQYDRKASVTPVKCCDNEKCGTGADCCQDKDCCKDKDCCSKKEGTAMKCCAREKCDKDAAACKDMQCCKDKECCKS
ncbi:MAG TPA: cation transporter [Ferruginibacter sp.]|nr:cation transporter [Ferruginibacter sp.]